MPTNRIMTAEERMKVLQRVKPVGTFEQPPSTGTPFGQTPIPWEDRLGNLDEWREHRGAGRKILPALSDRIKSTSVSNSILQRLRKLYPNESWAIYVKDGGIFLKFNGERRHRTTRPRSESGGQSDDTELFAKTG